MTEQYWESIEGLGDKRARILAKELGIRSIETLHASTVDEVVDALNGAGSRATAEEAGAWLQSARRVLKTEAARDWSALVHSARTRQTAGGTTHTAEAGSIPDVPLSSKYPFFIELELSDLATDIAELSVRPIAANGRLVALHRPSREHGDATWLVVNAQRGLYRMEARVKAGPVLTGPLVQVI